MNVKHSLTLTVEQTAELLGIGRSTAYELVRSGGLDSVRLRRRIVVPVAQLAVRLGVTAPKIWASLEVHSSSAGPPGSSGRSAAPKPARGEPFSLF